MKETYVESYFEQAMFNLLNKKLFADITITELCQKAGVGRTTFYRHYSSINDIVSKYLERTFSFTDYDETDEIIDRLEDLFCLLYKQKEHLLLLNKHCLLERLGQHLYKTTLKDMRQIFGDNNNYIVSFYAGAATSFILAWIDKQMIETPERLSQLFYDSLNGIMAMEQRKKKTAI